MAPRARGGGTNDGLAASLDQAARLAYARAAPEIAAALAEQAMRLTPPDRPDDMQRRAIEVCEYQLKAGDTHRARVVLNAVAETVAPGPTRARLLARLAVIRAIQEGFPDAIATCDAAIRETESDPELMIEILCLKSAYMSGTVRLPMAEAPAERALDIARTLESPPKVRRVRTYLAYVRFLMGRGFDTSTWETVLAHDPFEVDPGLDPWFAPELGSIWALMLQWSDRFDEAARLLRDMDRRAVRDHNEGTLLPVLASLGELGCWTGSAEDAERCVRRMRDIALQFGQPSWAPLWLYLEAWLAAHRGFVDDARRIATEGIAQAERDGYHEYLVRYVALLGTLELSRDNLIAARASLDRAARLGETASYGDPGIFRFDADLIETLLGLREFEEAQARLTRLEERGRTLGRAWALATGARCRGLLAAAQGDHQSALIAFEQALDHHRRVQQPYELARTWLAFGTVQRRFKQRLAAREALGRAVESFRALGMPLWASRAESQMQRTGGRAAGSHGLTPTERQVAELVAEGKTNREIAEQTFSSVKTVEAHLTRIYDKLDVRTRTGLTRSILGR